MRFEFGTLKISLFSSIFNNCDFYLCDLFGVWSAGLQDFHLLVHIGTVHPFCSSGFFVRLVEASKQSSKWTRKAKNQSLNKSMNFKSSRKLFTHLCRGFLPQGGNQERTQRPEARRHSLVWEAPL